MKKRTMFAIVGYVLVGLSILTFVLHALLQIKTGSDWGYRNSKNQPMTYLGALATLGVMAIVGIVMLYYRLKSVVRERRERMNDHSRRIE
jgi:uncharacterized BrkB/YihY/UPF0761 family membrane protein